MKIPKSTGILVISLLFLSGCSLNSPSQTGAAQADCLYTDQLTTQTAVPNWQSQYNIHGSGVNATDFSPYAPLQSYTIGGKTVAWQRNADAEVVLPGKLFSNLILLDLIHTKTNTSQLLGQIHQVDLTVEEWREVVRFLYTAQIIQTYQTVGSEVCFDLDNDATRTYTAYLDVTVDGSTYEFNVYIDKETGNITVKRTT